MAHIAESTHWYTLTGDPAYQVPDAKGNMRPTTLRDARKLNLVPSVTTIIRMAAAPALENWKAEQLLMAALTLPRLPAEPESAWLNRVRQDSREQGRKAAERGTAIHASLQGHFEGQQPTEEHWDYVKGVVAKIQEWAPEEQWVPEASFAHALGFGGKTDLHSTLCSHVPFVLDFKTKEFSADNLPKTWDEHAMQLAAYRVGLGMQTARCAIVFVSVTVPGLVHLCELSQEELHKGWDCFESLLRYWQAKSGYRPNFEKLAA